MAIVERYLIREVAKPLAVVLAILTAMFASFSAAQFMSQSAQQTLGMNVVMELVALKTLVAQEGLLPIALYLSVVLGLGRLHNDHEMMALRAAGIGEWGTLRAVLAVALPAALLIGALELYARPWAYDRVYNLQAQAGASIDVDHLQPGRFQGKQDTGRVVYAKRIERPDRRLDDVLLYRDNGQSVSEIVLAREARQPEAAPGKLPHLLLRDGTAYRLDRGADSDRIVRFKDMDMELEEPDVVVGYKRKAATSTALALSTAPSDIAEFQWRLSRPLAMTLLALFGVPLSRSAPRRGRYAKMFAAALLYAVYFNLVGLARTWVEHGTVGKIPGIWWVDALMAAALVLVLPCWPKGLFTPIGSLRRRPISCSARKERRSNDSL